MCASGCFGTILPCRIGVKRNLQCSCRHYGIFEMKPILSASLFNLPYVQHLECCTLIFSLRHFRQIYALLYLFANLYLAMLESKAHISNDCICAVLSQNFWQRVLATCICASRKFVLVCIRCTKSTCTMVHGTILAVAKWQWTTSEYIIFLQPLLGRTHLASMPRLS